MSRTELLERARALVVTSTPTFAAGAGWTWRHRTLVLAGAVVLLVALNASTCRRAASAEAKNEAASARAEEEGKARKAQVPVVQLVPQAVVNEEAERALAKYPELVAAKNRLEAQVGALNAALIIMGETDEVKAHGTERPGEPPTSAGAAAAPVVLLRDGDGLRFSLLGGAYDGKRGAEALLLSIGARRSSDDVEIGRGPLSVPLTSAFRAPPSPEACTGTATPERAWRAGPSGGATGQGWVVGAAGTYRLDLWGWRPETMATVSAGPGGVAVLGAVLF